MEQFAPAISEIAHVLDLNPEQVCEIKAFVASMVDVASQRAKSQKCQPPKLCADHIITSSLDLLTDMLDEKPKKYREFCEILHSMKFPPARLPWVPVIESNRARYQLYYGNDVEQINCNVQKVRMNSATIAYYLPKSYHAMDCLTLLENSCGNKSLHFANATQFFTFNQIYGLQFWNQLTSLLYLVGTKQQFQKTLYLQTNMYHSSNTQRKLFANEGDLHLCETSAEFLLEPWLVMQLPWHPALYYQWLAASLPEVFKAKKQLSEFYFWPIPKQTFLAVAKLLSMVETLHRRIILGFRLINWLPNSKDSYSSGFDLNSNIALLILNLIVLPSLPTIEFFVGDEFSTVVRAVKRMAWSYTSYKGESSIEDERFAYTGYAETDDDRRMPAFDLLSDDSGVPTHMFGRINLQEIKDELQKLPVIITFSRMASLIDHLREKKFYRDGVLQQWINRDKDIKMLKKNISKRLKGEVTFTDAMWKEYSHCFAKICRGFAENADFLKGVQPNDVSVIYNTQCLRLQYLQAMDEDKCCALVYFVLKKAGRKVHLSATDSSGPQMNLETAEQLLELKSEKWTLETLKAKIPKECKTAINWLNPTEICPDIEAGYHDIIKAFELRIKKLVYHMFDESSTKGLDSCFNFPEWQFIQYILPCFVTLIGQHATNPRSKPNELLAYTRFVHNLIQSFESNLIYKMGRGEPSLLIVTRFRDTPEEVWINLAKNLTVQLQEVESELGMLMFGTQKRMKRADEAEVLQAQIFFRMLKETLKSTTIGRGEPIVFSGWGETLMRLMPRMKTAIQKEVLLPTNPFPTNNLLRAMEIMQELTNLADICNNPKELDDAREILDLASQKLKIMLGKQQSAVRDTMDKKKYQEMQKLTVQQLLGFVLFLLVFKWNANMLPFLQETKSPRHSSGNRAAYNYANQTWAYLKAAMQPLLSDKQGNYLAWVMIDSVKKWMPISEALFTLLAEKNDMKDDVVRYSLPTIPIRYCWGCDKFEGLEIKMTMCKLCVENRAFVHNIHWFCSCECEEKVLAERHLEEHNLFLQRKLGRMSI